MTRAALLAAAAPAALLASAGPARADPFTLGAIIAQAAVAATVGGTATAGTIALASIAIGAVTIGAGYLLTALFAPSQKPENGTVAVQEPIPYRPFAYGTCAPQGVTLHKEAVGSFLGVVNCIVAHEIDSIIGLYFNDDAVTPVYDGYGNVTSYNTSATDGRYKPGYIGLETRNGGAGQGYLGSFASTFSASWPASSTGQGLALLGMVCQSPPKSKANLFTTIFPYAEPKPRAVIRAAKVYDPRVASQDPNNPSTWTWSDNAILCLLHWRCFSPFGSLLPYATAILPRVTDWIEAANRCDDQVALKAGGTERRYRVGGWSTTEQDRRSTTAALLAACDGWMCDLGDGTVTVEAGVYYAPTVVLTDADILGFTLQRDRATKDSVNRITARYTSPDNGYVSAETDPMDNTADQALRFGPVRAAQMDLLWVQSTGQASRLQKREFIRQGKKKRGTLVLGLSGLNACFARRVTVRSNTIPNMGNLVIEVAKPQIDIVAGRVTIQFVESGPDIDSYDPNADESAGPYVPTRPASAGLPIPANPAAKFAGAGSATVSWDVPFTNGSPDLSFSYFVQTRIAATGSAAAGPWTLQEFITPSGAGRISVTTSGGPTGATGTVFEAQVLTEASSGQVGAGSTIVQYAGQ